MTSSSSSSFPSTNCYITSQTSPTSPCKTLQKMNKFELVFIPMPGMGHLVSTVEMATLLVTRDPRLSITMLGMKMPFDSKASEYIQSLSESLSNNPSLRLIVLPELPAPKDSKDLLLKVLLDSYKPHVKEAVSSLLTNPLAGFVLDMFTTTMVDVAKELGVPSYVYYTSSAAYLAFSLHLEEIYRQKNSNEAVNPQFKNPDFDLRVSSLIHPIPSKVIPGIFFMEKGAVWIYEETKRLRTEMKGILINTFEELESHVMCSLSSDSSLNLPPLYSIGPILHLNNNKTDRADVLKWLDDQPPSSVVFLCFGSRGSFEKGQVEEIAEGLERSGVRFVWTLRKPPPKEVFQDPTDYTDFKDILPEGFLDRTAEVGRVIGWAPQVEILGHPATGGFVSHCGWNSTLESLWHGVPMATWPMYAEQQFNAYEMVVELGLAVEITVEYRKEGASDEPRVVSGEEIEKGIRKLMEEDSEVRKKVKGVSEESRRCVMEGGSSYVSMGKFIEDVLATSPRGRC